MVGKLNAEDAEDAESAEDGLVIQIDLRVLCALRFKLYARVFTVLHSGSEARAT